MDADERGPVVSQRLSYGGGFAAAVFVLTGVLTAAFVWKWSQSLDRVGWLICAVLTVLVGGIWIRRFARQRAWVDLLNEPNELRVRSIGRRTETIALNDVSEVVVIDRTVITRIGSDSGWKTERSRREVIIREKSGSVAISAALPHQRRRLADFARAVGDCTASGPVRSKSQTIRQGAEGRMLVSTTWLNPTVSHRGWNGGLIASLVTLWISFGLAFAAAIAVFGAGWLEAP